MWHKGVFDLALMADLQSLWVSYKWFEEVGPLARYGGSFLLIFHILVTTTFAKIQSDDCWREKAFVVAQRSVLLLGALLVGAPFIFSAAAVLVMKVDRYELSVLCVVMAKVVPSWDNFWWGNVVEFFWPTATKSMWFKLLDFCYSLI